VNHDQYQKEGSEKEGFKEKILTQEISKEEGQKEVTADTNYRRTCRCFAATGLQLCLHILSQKNYQMQNMCF
jgi:hypothetical protein